jgi:NifU-like protein involved in Fe-S cluster formation
VKIHCSVLAEEALKAAIEDYETKTGSLPKVASPATA